MSSSLYMCTICNKVWAKEGWWRKHMKEKHPEIQITPHCSSKPPFFLQIPLKHLLPVHPNHKGGQRLLKGRRSPDDEEYPDRKEVKKEE